MYFWREHRYNWKLFIVDEILTLVAYNTACLVEKDIKVLQALIILSLFGIFLLKTYYVVTALILYRSSENEDLNEKSSNFKIKPMENIP